MNDPKLNQFLRENPVGVVSTSGKGGIESAAVYYMVDTDGTIYLNSRRDSRKSKNIIENPEVSFLAFQKDTAMTLQVRGSAEIIEDISKITDTYTALLKRMFEDGDIPPILNIGMAQVDLIKITPTWMRFGNFSHGEHSEDMFTTIIDKSNQ